MEKFIWRVLIIEISVFILSIYVKCVTIGLFYEGYNLLQRDEIHPSRGSRIVCDSRLANLERWTWGRDV